MSPARAPRAPPIMPPGATKNVEKRIVLLIVKFSENGICDLVVHLHFSYSVFWPMGDTSLNLSWPCPILR